MAHDKGINVFIDEAWFNSSLFHPEFRYYSSINSGADYIPHSAHKVVSAFSQASYIHVNDPDFEKAFPHFAMDNVGHDTLKILIDVSRFDYSNQDIHRYLLDEIGLEIDRYAHSIKKYISF